MISKPHGGRLSRWAAGALVVGTTTAVMAVPFAGTAAAAPATTPVTSITASQSTYNTSTGTPVTITGTYTPANANAPIQYTVTQGPDVPATPGQGTNCSTPTAGNFSCTFTPGNTTGTDKVDIYGDNDNSGSETTGDVKTTVTVNVVSGAPAHVALSPDSQTTATGTCAAYTVNVTDANNKGVPNSPVSVTATAVQNTAGATLTECTPTNGTSAASPSSLTFTTTTDSTGAATFSFKSDTAGTSTVTAKDGGASDQSTQTFTAGGLANAKNITVAPTSYTGYTRATASFVATVTNQSGQALQGIPVNYMITSGPDQGQTSLTNPGACGSTDASGQATCSFTNGGTAGPDNVTFYVNNATTNATNGPDPDEPQTTATANFTALPTFTSVKATCQDKTAAGGGQGASCTVPTDQTATPFTATVLNGTTPVSGVTVNFAVTATGGPTPSDFTPASGSCVTGSDGTCTFTVTEPKPVNGEQITVTPSVGATNGTAATETYATRTATAVTLTPSLQTVQNGTAVNITASETDQFGQAITTPTQSFSYTVGSGNANGVNCTFARNAGKSGTASTDASGKAAISYTDAGVNPTSECDQVTVTNTTSGGSSTATVNFTTQPATPATITLSGVNTTAAPTAVSPQAVSPAAAHQVQATVQNSGGQNLAGVSVTFTVSQGFVGASGATSTTGSTSYTTTTDSTGKATAYVGSTKTGTQTVTATAGSASASGTITYTNSTEAPTKLTLTPATATIPPGQSQRFTATVTDQYGNGVANQSVTFSQSGPGSIGPTSTVTAQTDANGQVTITLTTLSTDSGTGSITATDAAIASPPNPAGSGTATSTYTVANGVTSLSLSASTGTKAGGTETITAAAKRQDGTAAPNVIVRFSVTGANSATGSATTNSSGVATFSYKAANAGTDNISAYADTNNDGAQQPTEPSATTTASIAKANTCPSSPTREHPTITAIHSGTRGHVTIHVTSHPKIVGASVHYYKISPTGHRHYLGKSYTGKAGRDSHQFKLTPGKVYKFQVKVYAGGDCRYAPGYSGRTSQRVHK